MTGVSYRNRRIRPKLVPAQSGGGTLTPGDSHAKRQEPNGTARRRDCGTAHDLVREGLLHHRQGSREFDVKDAVTDPDPASNPTDDREAAVLEDHEDDPVLEEITSLINSLSEDEQIDLVALLWLGRDDYAASDWPAVREEAARAHNENTASYLLGTPLLGDFLEEGLSMLGHSCEEFEIGRF
jgi:hypothetical protein